MPDSRKKKEALTFSRYLHRRILLLLAAPVVVAALLWTGVELSIFPAGIESLRGQYVEERKFVLREEVTRVAGLIDTLRRDGEARSRLDVRERVEQGWGIVDSLYRRYGRTMPRTEIIRMAAEALRPIRWNGGRGYYFMTGLDGFEHLFATRPEIEGAGILELRSSDGRPVIREMIDLVRKSGEGFISYPWTHPDRSGNNHEKVSYIKLHPGLGVFVGSGSYLVDIEAEAQTQVLDLLGQLTFGRDGYIFVYSNQSGLMLKNRANPDLVGTDVRDLRSPDGQYIIREMNTLTREHPEGDFISYVWPRPGDRVHASKLTFVIAIPAWDWVIGTGIYLNEIETAIDNFRTAMSGAYQLRLVLILLVLAASTLGGFLFSRRISRRLQGILGFIGTFYQQATRDGQAIALDAIPYREFRDMALVVNEVISRQRSTLAELQDSEKRYRSLFEASNDAIFIHDMDGRIMQYNDRALQLFPFLQARVAGRTLEGLFPESNARRVREYLQVLAGTGAVRMEIQARSEGEDALHIDMSSTMVDREAQVAQTLMRDVSQAAMAREKIERLNRELARKIDSQSQVLEQTADDLARTRELALQNEKMAGLGRLVSVLGHEIGTPLGIGITLSSMLADQSGELGRALAGGTLTKSDLERFVQMVNESAQLVNHNLQRANELMSNAKVMAVDQATGQKRDFEVRDYLSKIIQSMEPQIRKTPHQIRLDCPEGIVIRENPGIFYQVLTNLINNSLIHGLDNHTAGTVSIRVARRDDVLELVYEDDGKGIAPEIRERVFDPYFSTRLGSGGSGLGLHIVRSMIEDAGGSVSLEASGRDESGAEKGVRFVIRLTLQP